MAVAVFRRVIDLSAAEKMYLEGGRHMAKKIASTALAVGLRPQVAFARAYSLYVIVTRAQFLGCRVYLRDEQGNEQEVTGL